jgi:hypothetical protein
VKRKSLPIRGGKADGFPPLSFVSRANTSRLIPSRYSIPDVSVLSDVASGKDIATAFALDDLTNDRLLAENFQFDGIGPLEMVAGIPYASIINAAFTHAHPEGSRFNDPERGAWYAGLDVSTSQAEVIYHKTIELDEMGVFVEETTYDEYLADFNCEFHDLRSLGYSHPALNPFSYKDSQLLTERLFAIDSHGVIYPSVRDHHGTCIGCFRPALVTNVRKSTTFLFRWAGKDKPVLIETAR